MLGVPVFDEELKMAFARPGLGGKEFQIAAAFHVREEPKPDPLLPPVIAELVNNERPDVLATAYAPAEPDYAKASPFETLLKDDTAVSGRFIPPLAQGDHGWVSSPLPPSVFSEQEQRCLAAGIYFEARGESVKGQAAVAQVILNRVRNPSYPGSICGVVYQNEKWRHRCQFSFACDGIKDRVASREHYEMAEEVALAVTSGKIWLPEVGSSTHYHATYVRPRWARTMEKMMKIGQHIFYRA
jgi:spore germination cell wall hydrolase CwlJ-like protein